MAFDSNQQHTVLFGGRSSGGLTGDTWQWDGTAWTQVEDTGPPVRESHAMVYAADRNRAVLFGGDGVSLTALSDTWEWDATHWTHVQDLGPAREGSAMAFRGSGTALFGGFGVSSSAQANPAALFGDTWEWDGQQWVERQDMGPQARWLHAMAFDSTRSRLVLFGGTPALARDSSLGDTWEADGPGTNPGGGVVLTTFWLNDPPLHGGLELSGPAPPGGVHVQISADHPFAVKVLLGVVGVGNTPVGPPWSILISAGVAAVEFFAPHTVSIPSPTTFTATLGDVTKTVSSNTFG